MPDLEDEIRRGHEAQRILTDPLFIEKVTAVEQQLIRAWQTSQPGDTQLRETLYYRYKGLKDVIHLLSSDVNTGTFATTQLEERKNNGGRGRGA